MTEKELVEIFETADYNPTIPFKFRNGMQLLFTLFERDYSIEPYDDLLTFGCVEDVLDKITPEQALFLAERGFGIREGSFTV